ncbi:response regulator transcription factor [Novosphingobium sediminicola]|uniref:DNA-binding response OmpR family regulator n=1 Tax=Novosphingobium sediminicola TaxID=563162 RepID=A0A7W6G6Z2_9SPHN|nr:response regulator transcription factor [Novosphingobium sediminicola]MBB3954447.1 DNA-binding response OmpR family regulator [Novosphingobium sediminicola]
MRVLVGEDDGQLANELAHVLRADNFVVDVADNGVDIGHLGSTEHYDAVVLDLGLPGEDGLSVLEKWRADACAVPVLVLTARSTWSDKAAGFQAGADDYLTKPFLPEEVVTRLRALIRRSQGHASSRIRCGALVYDTHSGAFTFHGQQCRLTAFEARVLSSLILRKNLVVPRMELAEHVYEFDAEVNFQSLEVIIGRIRRKIGNEMIETVRGLGYRLVGADQ